MGEENESFYDNLILESTMNDNQEIPICRIENILETPFLELESLTYHQKTLSIHQKTWKIYGPHQSNFPVQN